MSVLMRFKEHRKREDRRLATDKEALNKVVLTESHRQKNETLKVLDILRQTRQQRGGVGAPLQVPAHLQMAAEGKPSIVITDSELTKDGSAEAE